MFLLQMSGVPGSGKSTVAAHVVEKYGAVAVDYDVIKSAVLDAGFDLGGSTRASYEVMYAMARHLLVQGRDVVMDSPCFWPRIVNEGIAIAEENGAAYRYVECRVQDLQQLDERLRRRPRLRTHRPSLNQPPADAGGEPVDGEALVREWMDKAHRPADNYLQLDMDRPLADVLPEVDHYLKQSG
ncbi:putative kinase [Kribbella aluminosa]|uniref:Kinase n=1 Tax=Kribbella aluminosa TaxID=416017 RepID=A0ABS4UC41_9ACTN|nr:AAA family ATPase [Kribbella aluminosa]MBP2349181.1 putative kinase [Kribbella aluminosa]